MTPNSILQGIFHYINGNGAIVGLATFSVGLFWGNQQAIGRDKRKEFNDVALPVREQLLKQLQVNAQGRLGTQILDQDLLIRLGVFLGPRKKEKFDAAVAQWRESFQNCGHIGPSGLVVITNIGLAKDAAHQLLNFCELK
jgi:hypothetical protein